MSASEARGAEAAALGDAGTAAAGTGDCGTVEGVLTAPRLMSAIEKPGPTGADDWLGFVPIAADGDAAAVGAAAMLD